MPRSDPETLAMVVETVRFRAGPYLLEGELAYPEEGRPPLRGAVLAGSHPLLGGNMHNNVIRGVGDGLAEQGLVTLRFNYRGVGHSQGPAVDVARHMAQFWETSHVPDELDLAEDVQGAADCWRQAAGPAAPLVLVGYSFGCALLAQVCLPEPPAALVLIAPPLGKHDYEAFTSAGCPILVIVSEDDFSLHQPRLGPWFERLPPGRRLIKARRDNHFFRGHESWLVNTILNFLQSLEEIPDDAHP